MKQVLGIGVVTLALILFLILVAGCVSATLFGDESNCKIQTVRGFCFTDYRK